MEFYKVKKLLEKNPKVLRDDPVISIDYHRIIAMIKQKKLVEKTSNHFDPANSYMADWKDVKDVERHEKARERAILAKFQREAQEFGNEGGGGGADAINDLNEAEDDTS